MTGEGLRGCGGGDRRLGTGDALDGASRPRGLRTGEDANSMSTSMGSNNGSSSGSELALSSSPSETTTRRRGCVAAAGDATLAAGDACSDLGRLRGWLPDASWLARRERVGGDGERLADDPRMSSGSGSLLLLLALSLLFPLR